MSPASPSRPFKRLKDLEDDERNRDNDIENNGQSSNASISNPREGNETQEQESTSKYHKSTTFSFTKIFASKFNFYKYMPIFMWLPKYSIYSDFSKDLIAGLTISTLLIPQGMAYAGNIFLLSLRQFHI